MLVGSPSMGATTWESTARALGVTYVPLARSTPGAPWARAGYESFFQRAAEQGADGLLIQRSTEHSFSSDLILSLAERYRMPASFPNRLWVERGGLMAYEPLLRDAQRRAAEYVDRVLRGTKPGDLPIEQPSRYQLVVNARTIRTLGLTLPSSFLAQVDEVIE